MTAQQEHPKNYVEPDSRRRSGKRPEPVSLLVVEEDSESRRMLVDMLKGQYALVECASSIKAAEQIRRRCHFDLFIVSVGSTGASGVEWLSSLREQEVRADLILIADYADLDTAMQALRAGAADLLVKPFRTQQLSAAIERCLRRRRMLRENFLLRRSPQDSAKPEGIIGDSPPMRELYGVVERIASTAATVLLEGETGTGKELIARVIHRQSGRSGPFVAVNCGALAPELLESELFGHTKGAFTGAHASREGLVAHAHQGTILLDEIGEMPLAMQANLLRVLEERTVRPVGADHEVAVNCRIIAATNVDLEEHVRQGRFREDLYYRLNVLKVSVPPLRDRLDDIPALTKHFSDRLAAELGLSPVPFEHQDFVRLREHHWPGNIRELRNAVERCLLLGKLPRDCRELAAEEGSTGGSEAPREESSTSASGFPLSWTLEQVEKHHIKNVLESVAGNKSEAARRLGVSRKTLERKVSAWLRDGGEDVET